MEAGGGGIYFGEKLRASGKVSVSGKGLITRRLRAWGVLGFATGGCFIFSLLTLLFSGAVILQTQGRKRSFGSHRFFLTYLAAALYAC
jgi:hypothetical protein